MAERIDITDPADRRLDDFRDLVTADRRPDRPGGRGLVIAEGAVVVRRLLQSPYPIRGLLGVARRYDELADDLSTQAVPYFVVEPELMAEVVGFHLNRGVLATANRAASPLPDELISRATALAVLEGVGDHENLGSIFRSAAALGIDGILLGAGCADPLYRRSVRVSMGTVLQIPFAPLPGLAGRRCGSAPRTRVPTRRVDAAGRCNPARRGGTVPGQGRRGARLGGPRPDRRSACRCRPTGPDPDVTGHRLAQCRHRRRDRLRRSVPPSSRRMGW